MVARFFCLAGALMLGIHGRVLALVSADDSLRTKTDSCKTQNDAPSFVDLSNRAILRAAKDKFEIRPDYQEALKHAPILWFSDQEQYYPTMPFFSAFDGVDNNYKSNIDPNKLDFSDLEEIAPLDNKEKMPKLASWDKLHDWYEAFPPGKKKSLTTVFYKIDTCDLGSLTKILKNDDQFVHRVTERLSEAEKKYWRFNQDKPDTSAETLKVYQYYFYYIEDTGLQGHTEDLECVFIFVPQNPAAKDCRLAVGIGHAKNTPNNVLFYKVSAMPNAAKYQNHLHFLVELGGHSNAPDFNANGRFEPGMDANWHVEYLWGTRDLQAVFGGGYLGQYELSMTLPRDSTTKIFPPKCELLDKSPNTFCYRLLPAEDFRQFNERFDYESIGTSGAGKPEPDIKDIATQLEQFGFKINGLHGQESNVNRLDPEDKGKSIDRFELWQKDLIDSLPSKGTEKFGLSFWSIHQINKKGIPEWRVALMYRPNYSTLSPKLGAFELHGGISRVSLESKRQYFLGAYWDSYYPRFLLSLYLGALRTFANSSAVWRLDGGISLTSPEFSNQRFLRYFSARIGIRYDPVKNFDFKKQFIYLQLGIHQRAIPTTNLPYRELAKDKHRVWKHADYGKPTKVFKEHIYRPPWGGVGIWSQMEFEQKPNFEYKLALMVPPAIAPTFINGVFEFQGGFRQETASKPDLWKGVFAFYYHRFYGRLFSWYINAPAFTVAKSKLSQFSLGGGVSITPIFSDYFHWLQFRIGVRSNIDGKSIHFTRHRLELQLGIHY